ncbi:MAG TPA: cytochrome c biogenesis protein CcsA [Solirubrobacteraceae bacterium]|nr:cytochrome c biogenesis protein CcsA [Solirubrobacteraceae bacterium]
MYGKRLRGLALTTAALLTLTLLAVFFWAPNDRTEGFLQKIFYVHVPMAIITLSGFIAGGVLAIQHLRTGESRWDLRSYVAIHISLVFGVGVLVTGSIWAKAAWGHWWVWSEPTLVSFLLVMLLYATYQPLRFAIEDPERQARAASVFAIVAGVFVPICFTIVRLSTAYVHPRTLDNISGNLPGRMQLVFWMAIGSVFLLWLLLWRYEMASKHTSAQLRRLRQLLSEDDEALPPLRRSAAPTVEHAGIAGR